MLLLLVDLGRRDLLTAHPPGRRGGDVHRHILDEVVEVVGPRNEVRLAVHFHEDADLAAHVDVAADGTLRRGPAGALRGLRQSALAQQGHRLFHVAVGFGERGLALHHAGARLVAKLFDLCRRNLHRRHCL